MIIIRKKTDFPCHDNSFSSCTLSLEARRQIHVGFVVNKAAIRLCWSTHVSVIPRYIISATDSVFKWHPPTHTRWQNEITVQTLFWALSWFDFVNNLIGRAMAQAVSRRTLTAEARFRSRVSPRDLWLTKWHWDRFFLEYFGFLLSISFHRCSITWKSKKKNWSSFSSSSSQGCTISLKAAVRP
jgi:hypothetical protein